MKWDSQFITAFHLTHTRTSQHAWCHWLPQPLQERNPRPGPLALRESQMSSIALAAVTDFTTKPGCQKKKGQYTIRSVNPIDISPLCSKMQLNLLTAGYLTKRSRNTSAPCSGGHAMASGQVTTGLSAAWSRSFHYPFHHCQHQWGLPQPRDLDGETIAVKDLTKKVQADTLTTTLGPPHHHGHIPTPGNSPSWGSRVDHSPPPSYSKSSYS